MKGDHKHDGSNPKNDKLKEVIHIQIDNDDLWVDPETQSILTCINCNSYLKANGHCPICTYNGA